MERQRITPFRELTPLLERTGSGPRHRPRKIKSPTISTEKIAGLSQSLIGVCR